MADPQFAAPEGTATSYPCPVCGTAADEIHGCAGCGRPPDPAAAEVIRLNAGLPRLTADVDAARRAFNQAVARREAALARRADLAAQVRAAVAASRTAAASGGAEAAAGGAGGAAAGVRPPTPGATPAGGAPAQPIAHPPEQPFARPKPEASIRTVQSVLFVIGGLLLGSAAVVFTAVAWASFGVAGRAAILATVTVLTLLVPPVVQRRRLVATAETFAALGLLLVVLDGYAAWYVNLVGLADRCTATGYAGGVFAVTAVTGAAYGLVTRLTGPRYIALFAAQPVLPLVAIGHGLGPAGWATLLAVLAAGNLLVPWLAGRRDPVPAAALAVGWPLAGIALLGAAGTALTALATAGGLAATARAAGAFVLAAGVLLAAGWASRIPALLNTTAGVGVVAVAIAAARTGVEGLPAYQTLVLAAVTAATAAVMGLPRPARGGARIGALVVVGVAGVGFMIAALTGAVATIGIAAPVWRAHPTGTPTPLDWQVLAGLAVLAVAGAILLGRRAWHDLGVATAVLLAFAVPAAFRLPWWLPSAVDLLVAAVCAIAATGVRRPRPAMVRGCAAGVLAVHAVAVCLARPASTAIVLGSVLVLAAALAALDRRGAGDAGASDSPAGDLGEGDRAAGPVRRTGGPLGAAGVVAAVLALPGLAAATGELLDAGERLRLPWLGAMPVPLGCAFCGFVLCVVALVARRPRWPEYAAPAAGAVASAGLAVAVATLLASPAQFGVVAALVVLGDLVGAWRALWSPGGSGRDSSGRDSAIAVLAVPVALPALGALGTVLPAVAVVIFGPYGWLGSIWSGASDRLGLVPDGFTGLGLGGSFEETRATLTLAVLALVMAFLSQVRGATDRRWAADRWLAAARWALSPATLAVLVGCVAAGAPWPTLPAVSLGGGLAITLVVAFGRPSWASAGRFVFAALAVGTGLAGCLATRPATLVGLGAVVVVAAVCGVAGRAPAARAVAWLVAAAAAPAFAFAAARPAHPLPTAAYWVLAAAATTLVASYAVRRVAPDSADPRAFEAVLLETSTHLTACVALALTVGSIGHAAGVCTLWGVAVGLRGLRPGEEPAARQFRVVAAVCLELVAYWLLLASRGITLIEAYTVPAAAVALLAGALAVRRNPQLHSWTAYGPALLAGVVPSLAAVTFVEGAPPRRLALGVAAVVLVLAGSVRRRQAPVVVGSAALVVLALHEAVLLWGRLPGWRWIPLALAGLLVVGFAITYERRRRDMAALRQAVGRLR